MLRNYFKVALRYLARHKGYTAINVSGLAVGIAGCLLIMLFVKSEWSFDRFHAKADRIYRAWLEEHYEGQVLKNTTTPIPLAPVLAAGIPEVQTACRVYNFNSLVGYGNNTFSDPVSMVDSTFFNLFDFTLTDGSLSAPLPTGLSIVITQSTAKKYFGATPATGKILEMQIGADKIPFTVSGVVKDVPLESSLQFSMLIPFSNAPLFFSEGQRTTAWSNVSVETYFLLKEGVQASVAAGKIPAVMNPLVAKNYKPGEYNIRLQRITDIHLNNSLPAGNAPISDAKYSYILGTIGLLILLIACVNFVTLSIGRSATRALEVGVRKVLGAQRQQLIRQFWGEAVLITLVSLAAGILLAFVFLPAFTQLAARPLTLVLNGFTLLFCLGLVLVVGFISGIYPAFVLSGFKPMQVLKGRLQGQNMGLFRKALVVGQFVASIVMIICTTAMGQQLQYLRNKNLGYGKEHIVVIPTNKPRRQGIQLAQRFKTAVAQNPQVISCTAGLFSMAQDGWMTLGYTDDKNAFRQFRFNAVDEDFIATMGLTLVAGRGFEKGNVADSNNIIVNEALVKEYGWQDPIGQKLPGRYTQHVIGVLKDFHFESLHTEIKPVVLALKPDSIRKASTDVVTSFSLSPRISVRLRGGNVGDDIAFLKATWKAVAGNQDFEYDFLDEYLNAAYSQDEHLAKIVRCASLLSIFIACMGLFGLATLVVAKRTREIGIRKVLGADAVSIVRLLSKDFVRLVLLAAAVASPVAWWGLSRWFADFTYRIHMPVWVFFVATLVAVSVALLTVSFHAVKAALANPVKSLRTE